MSVVTVSRPRPSWSSGVARSPAEAAFPQYWKGLHYAIAPALGPTGLRFKDLTGHFPDAVGSAGTWEYDRGHAFAFTSTSTQAFSLRSDGSEILKDKNLTIVMYGGRNDGTDRAFSAWGVTGANDAARCGCHLPYSDGNAYFDFGGTGAPNRQTIGGLTYTNHDVWVQRAGDRGHQIWQNGEKVAGNSTAVSRTNSTGAFQLGFHGGIGNDLVKYRVFLVYHRELNQDEIHALSKDPFLPFYTKQYELKEHATLPLSGTDSLTISETESTPSSFQTDSDSLTVNETDSIGIPSAVYDPLVIQNGQIRELPSGASINVSPVIIQMVNSESTAITRGQPVASNASGEAQLCVYDNIAKVRVLGVVFDESVEPGETANIAILGPVEATTDEWDALTGDTGGLSGTAKYYVGSTAGDLAVTATTTNGTFQAPVGVAMSTTKLFVQPQRILRV